jgi:hypothetical protein|tara:strand:- start:110 stop:277 length:168 start_codon:yes stop_codon:yes gene_type:complete
MVWYKVGLLAELSAFATLSGFHHQTYSFSMVPIQQSISPAEEFVRNGKFKAIDLT